MFITIDELKTQLRSESMASIIRNDETLAQAAIDGAIAEAKGYLSRFDANLIFQAITDDRHQLLVIFVKDIAVWHLVNLVNPNIDLRLRKERYDRAIKWLEGVQAGMIVPDLPLATDENGSTTADIIKYGGNPKRNQHY